MIQILIAGDFCPKERIASLVEKGNYESVFGEVKEYTSKADYSIVNLEAPIVTSSANPIEKCGPNLKCTSKAIDVLKWANFDMVTLANNHFYDYGDTGVKETLDTCKKEGISIVGGGMNIQEASQTANIDIKGFKLAIINCCEHEFSIATEKTAGSNPLNPIQQYYAIQKAKKNADKVIVIVHGGHEHYQLPSPRMKETYRFFVDAGADAVINHHQHCYSGYEIYKERPIFYGLGNFCFDWTGKRNSIWNEGYMVMIRLEENHNVNFELIPYIQCDEKPTIKLINNKDDFYNNILRLNTIISNDEMLAIEHCVFMNKTSKNYLLALNPYKNRYLNALYIRGILPFPLSKGHKFQLVNYLKCESHLERLIFSLLSCLEK